MGGEGFDSCMLGVVESDGRQRDITLAESLEVGTAHIAVLEEFARHPVIRVAPRVTALFVFFNKAGGAHAGDPQAGELVIGTVGNIDVPEDARGNLQAAGDDLFDQLATNAGCSVPAGVGEGVEGKRDRGNAHDRAFGGGRDGTGIEHADAGIGAEIDAAEDEVGLGVEQQADGEFDTVGRGAADGGPKWRLTRRPRAGVQRFAERDSMANCRAFAVGGDDVDLAEVFDSVVKGVDASGLDAVVVGNQNSHDGWDVAGGEGGWQAASGRRDSISNVQCPISNFQGATEE